MSRASSLDDALMRRVVEAIKSGMHKARAAEKAGISESTFHRWMQQGDPGAHSNEPVLANMAMKELRALCKVNGLAVTQRSSRQVMTEALQAAGVGSWERYRRFRESVEEAEAELEQRLVAQWQLTMQPITEKIMVDGQEVEVIKRHANHKSISDFMARRFPERWSPTVSIELSGPRGGPIVTREERADQVADWLERIQAGEEIPELGDGIVEIETRAMGE